MPLASISPEIKVGGKSVESSAGFAQQGFTAGLQGAFREERPGLLTNPARSTAEPHSQDVSASRKTKLRMSKTLYSTEE